MSLPKRAPGEEAHGGMTPITLKGETFLLSPLTLKQGDTLRKYLRSKIKSPMQSVIKDLEGIDPKYHEAVLAAAAGANAGGSKLTAEAIDDIILSPEGCRFLFWISANANHPNLKLSEVDALIDESDVMEVFMKISLASGLERLGKAESPDGSATPTNPAGSTSTANSGNTR